MNETPAIRVIEFCFGIATTALVFMFFLGIVIAAIVWHYTRSASMVRQWARQNDLRLINYEYRHFVRGPFAWTSAKGQTVYYVTVEDQHGHVRNAWVRCGGYFLGLLSDEVEARWESCAH